MSDYQGISRKKKPPKLGPFTSNTSWSGDSLDRQDAACLPDLASATSDMVCSSLDSSVSINIGQHQDLHVTPDNLELIEHLGRGQYGVVERYLHRPSQNFLAIKRVALKQSNQDEQSRLAMDVDVLVKATRCKNIIHFYGALIWEGDLWIIMELMDCSLDSFYKRAHAMSTQQPALSEPIMAKISQDILNALNYLYSIKVIHRDIKPSNILINREGTIKLCDFGISGYLVNSVARTYDAGCRPYMAPERIDPPRDRMGYDIKSDVWSFGITILEIATGRYPYSHGRSFFEQLKSICTDAAPQLPVNLYSETFHNFLNQCLDKDFTKRPKYNQLIEHSFIKINKDIEIGHFVCQVLDLIEKT